MIRSILSALLLLSYTREMESLPEPSKKDSLAPLVGVVSTERDEMIPRFEKAPISGSVETYHQDETTHPKESFLSEATKSMFTKQNISVESLMRMEESDRSHNQRDSENFGNDEPFIEPWVESSTKSNETISKVVTELSADAFLPCRVGHLGDRQVSWIRKRDWFVLTSGDNLYAHSKRFIVLHEEGSQDWILRIKKVEKDDEGYYECQVSTGTGIISFLTHIEVSVPKAQLSGSRQLHINTGSSFFLRCFISKANPGLQHINWLHNGKLLNYDVDAQGISIFTKSSKSKISPETNESQERLTNRYIIMSQVDVHDANEAHSGNYTCQAPYVEADTAYVYVNEGDKTAAVQRIGMNSAPTSHSSTIITSAIIFWSLR